MKEKLIKTDLKKQGIINYDSQNPNIKKAQIVIFSYHEGNLYQPRIYTISGKYMIDNCGYYNIDEAKKSIDAYSD